MMSLSSRYKLAQELQKFRNLKISHYYSRFILYHVTFNADCVISIVPRKFPEQNGMLLKAYVIDKPWHFVVSRHLSHSLRSCDK